MNKSVFEGEVERLNARALDGSLEILSHHAALLTVLAPGKVSYDKNTLELAGPAILEVNKNRARIFMGS